MLSCNANRILTILGQVSGLRHTLESSDDEDEEPEDLSPTTTDLSDSIETLVFSHDLDTFGIDNFQCPSEQVRHALLHLYRTRVDAIFKAVHWPSFIAEIDAKYRQYPPAIQAPARESLEFAIYFAACCSITEEECGCMLLGERASLLRYYRRAAEAKLSKANFILAKDLTSLQAFVIYLVSFQTLILIM